MNENQNDSLDFNRRDFLKSGSVATLMAMLGGVPLFAQTNETAAAAGKQTPKVKVAVIGLGAWGRELLNNLARIPQADVAAICDTYPAFLKRCSSLAPAATQTEDYKTILANKDIKAVLLATPTHQHKEIALAALKAGKHVYCEAPLANTVEDGREIALAAKAAAASHILFQAGLQLRADPQRLFLLPFIRSGALGKFVMARAQWHKKTSWRATSPKPEREKALNWRLYKETSLGLAGELGCHQIDQASWFLNSRPRAVTGFGSLILWNQEKGDDRDVDDTVQAVIEYAGGVNLMYDATLANSFEANYEVFYGSDAAVALRENKAWMFKEVDSPLLGWEVYATKETFYKDTGIVLRANASKSAQSTEQPTAEELLTSTPIFYALQKFVLNASDLSATAEDFLTNYPDDKDGLMDALAKVPRRPTAGYLEGFQATVTAVKTNEAIVGRKRIELKRELYELS